MNPRPLNQLDPRLQPLAEAILAAGKVPGASVAVVADDRTYHLAHGVKSVSGSEPVTLDTAFNIGSCSKAFVSATVASLVADGLVKWDDTVVKWVPELELWDPEITKRVTLRDLSANRLGLPRSGLTEFGLDPRHGPEEVFTRLRHTAPAFPFRDRFGYVNAGHTVNAVAAGRITGKGFLATLRERILAPLGMTGTSGGTATPNELTDLAGWHVLIGDSPVAIDPVFTDQYLGSGGMVVRGRDALQWLRLHLNGGLVDGKQVIAREALAETHRPHSPAVPGKDIVSLFYPGAHMAAYALGWGVSDLEGHPLVMHSGSDLGVTAMTLLLPRSGIGVAVYCNANGGGPAALSLAHAIAGTLLGLKPRDWFEYFKALSAPPAAGLSPPQAGVAAAAEAVAAPLDLSLYPGTYRHPADGPLIVINQAGRLIGRIADAYRLSFALKPAGEHAFQLEFLEPEWQGAAVGEQPIVKFKVEAGRAVQADLSLAFTGRPFHRVDETHP
jgi:CubicO group peptidase (beta-lactamase class C family)